MTLLRMEDIEVVEVLTPEQESSVGVDWPCPACGDRVPLEDGITARIRNRAGIPLERIALLCRYCVELAQNGAAH